MICSTLNGLMVLKHPTLGVLVREDGMVFNRTRGGNPNNYEWTRGNLHHSGYRHVMIQGKLYSVHRIVAETFLHNPDGKPTVDHINRIRDDNRVCNLRWATHKEQSDNNGFVLNRADYGVRYCDDKIEYQRAYHQANLEDVHAKHCEYYKAHRDELCAKKREYYKAHRAEKLEYVRKYRERKKIEESQCKEKITSL